MNNIRKIVLAGVTVLFSGTLMAQSSAADNIKPANANQGNAITVNPRNDTREVSPVGTKIDSKKQAASYGSIKEMRAARHHRHHHRRHHKHHKKNANQQQHSANRHHKI
jgi:hypothetical protein